MEVTTGRIFRTMGQPAVPLVLHYIIDLDRPQILGHEVGQRT
jgi:hypothetical protein